MNNQTQWQRAVIAGILGVALFGAVYAKAAEKEITSAQSPLEKQNLTITTKDGKKHQFLIEVAKTPREQEIGEMFRNYIPDNGGMIFIWPYPQPSNMWMKNTQVPLDIVFVGIDNRIQSISENAVPYSLAPISSQGVVNATLELKGGITAKLGITVGDSVDSPSLQDKK